ncbi:hypothetical protein ABW19_dt0200473 [Dactylella cylindrospora]|nr:hypothetical protein ABW19_dt0200473 [Dactylella cylindrospora]
MDDSSTHPPQKSRSTTNKYRNRNLAIDKNIDQNVVRAMEGLMVERRKARLAALANAAQTLEMSPDQAALLQEFIIESLVFPSMRDREGEVAQAHKETFGWVFTKDEGAGANFVPWLKGDDGEGIYWIGGKKGSGKSTLMRYIYEEGRTKEHLQEWADGEKLHTAGFFFWISGSIEQRSQSGLLKSLLHQLLEGQQHLVATTFPSVWATYGKMSTQDRIKAKIQWPIEDLMQGFKNFLNAASRGSKICLFVDGLDEFDGNHQDIIDLFVTITKQSDNIKACLSSRAWPVFEKAFQHTPSMHLQDLTKGGMERYVTDSFRGSVTMRRISRVDREGIKKIAAELVTKADGVFLWTIIVVKRILESTYQGDTAYTIGERLSKIPSELDDLFRLILLEEASPQDIQDSSEIFQLLRAREDVCEFTGDESSSRLELWELSLAFESRSKFQLESAIEEAEDAEVVAICGAMRSHLGGQCAGLLEVHDKKRLNERTGPRFVGEDDLNETKSLAKSKVTYLHRTVKDFLASSEIWGELLAATNVITFDPHIGLVKSYILQLKLPLEEPRQHRRLDEWWPSIALTMTHARYATSVPPQELTAVMDELYSTQSQYWFQKDPDDPNDNWVRNTFATFEERKNTIFHEPFLSLAAKFGLRDYVIQKVKSENIRHISGRPLLSYATDYLINRRSSIYPLSDPAFVQLLLENEQDPNQPYVTLLGRPETPWVSCLDYVREACRRGWAKKTDAARDIERWVNILQRMVLAGADASAVVSATRKDAELSACEVIDKALGITGNDKLKELSNALAQRAGLH